MPHHFLAPHHGRPVSFVGERLATVGGLVDGADLYRTERGHHVVASTRANRPVHVFTFPDASAFGDAALNDRECAALAEAAGITASFLDYEPPLDDRLPDFVTIVRDEPWQHELRFNGRRLHRTALQVHHVSSDHTDLYLTAGRQYVMVSRIHNARINRWQVVHLAVFRSRNALVHALGYTQGAMGLYYAASIDVTLHLP